MAEAGNTYPYPSTLNVANFVTIKLSDSSNNYSIWKAQMLCLLESQELVGFIDGTIQSPSEKVTDDHGFRRTNKGTVELLANQDYLRWKRSDRLVKGWILGSLAEEMLHKVAEKVSARDVYLELNEICCPISQLHESEGITVEPTLEEAESAETKKDYKYYLPLYRAALSGNWGEAEAFLRNDKGASRAQINSLLQTAVHIAVGSKNGAFESFTKKLVLVASTEEDALAIKDCSGETPLHYAARFGNLDAAKLIVKENSNLPHVASDSGLYPIHLAAEYGQKSVHLVRYFFNVTEDLAPYTGHAGVRLLYRLICSDLYDLAMEMVKRFPDLAKYSANELSPMELLATKVNVLCYRQSIWQRLLNLSLFPIEALWTVTASGISRTGANVKQPQMDKHMPFSRVTHAVHDVIEKVRPRMQRCVYRTVGFYPSDHKTERIHQSAIKLAECLCEKLENSSEEEIHSIIGGPLFQAACLDNYKFVEIIVERFPSLLYYCNKDEMNILHAAVKNHCEEVFKLVHEMSSEHIHQLMASIDSSNNTMLHLAGKLSPKNKLSRIHGGALQMQRELQWFKKVMNCLPPTYYDRSNNEGKRAYQIFTEEHAYLKEEGEKWLKDTASACTIVSALIATVAFAAAVTVPGGNNSNNDGLPILLKDKAFTVFFVSNGISLFTSCTSLLGFLSIWTSRYSEEDFLITLPEGLMTALADMLISIICMIISFCSILYLVSGQKRWVFALVLLSLFPRAGIYLHSIIQLLSALTLTRLSSVLKVQQFYACIHKVLKKKRGKKDHSIEGS